MDKTNKFKFIRKTKEIQDFRGDRLDDGLVLIAYKFEQQPVFEPIVIKDSWSVCPKNDWPKCPSNRWDSYTYNTFTTPLAGTFSNTATAYNCSAPLKDEGITAKGRTINQEYQYGYTDSLEDTSHVIILRLRGISGAGRKVKEIVTTRSRIQCEICGRKWKSNVKYCGNCGNYLR
jgi:hypothetical protein